MTIETITDIIHEYMYSRLNDSNNSNDGRNKKNTYRKRHRKESGQKKLVTKEIKNERNIRDQNT